MDSRKPLTAGEKQEIGELLYRAGFEIANGGTVDNMYVVDMHRTCRRLLSLLTPPPDAAVREAAERVTGHANTVGGNGMVHLERHLRTLLRAVQAPRLPPEQVEAVRMLHGMADVHGVFRDEPGQELERVVRAAFPEAFAGEV